MIVVRAGTDHPGLTRKSDKHNLDNVQKRIAVLIALIIDAINLIGVAASYRFAIYDITEMVRLL